MGSLGYADDFTLLSPSIRGLNRMLSICEEFGKQYYIKFNSKKSMCIQYGEKYYCEKAQLNEKTIIWVNSVKHLGNIVLLITVQVYGVFLQKVLENYYAVEYSHEKNIYIT